MKQMTQPDQALSSITCLKHDDHKHGSFLNGLTIGFLAGATGYFLFRTKRGGKLRQDLSDEWDKAKKDFAAKGLLKDEQTSLKDFLNSLFTQLKTPQSAFSKKKIKKKVSLPPAKVKKFKGV